MSVANYLNIEGRGKFGPLLGVLSMNDVYCKFLVYAVRNAEVLTSHEIPLKSISKKPGWLEYDPVYLWKCVVKCIEATTINLVILDINPLDVAGIGIVCQRGTIVLWNKFTGVPLYNALSWSDTRADSVVKDIMTKVKGRRNVFKPICGLPISSCFSALKLKWLIENEKSIYNSIKEKNCFFGTLDTWLLWNLTGGIEEGIHVTDVTNAAYTMLMNLETLKWDSSLCLFFEIPEHILPSIKSCSEEFGFINEGPLKGTSITSCMGDQPAALLGQMCIKPKDATCSIDDSCFILINTGQQILNSDHGLHNTVAFKLGPKASVFYATEGIMANAGSAVYWTKELIENDSSSTSDIQINSTCNGTVDNLTELSSCVPYSNSQNALENDLVFIPSFNGIYSPYWQNDTKGMILGITNNFQAKNLVQSAYEAICFHLNDILQSFEKDSKTWGILKKLSVAGDLSDSNNFLQLLADIIGITVDRPQTISPSCVGSMLAAGITIKLITLDSCQQMWTPPSDYFIPSTTIEYRNLLHQRWQNAVKRCFDWENQIENEELLNLENIPKDSNNAVRKSLPATVFIISSFVLHFLLKIVHGSKS